MIKITFPDGSVREYEAGVTGLQIAESISSRLAQDVLACGVNGEIVELNRPINEDASVVLYKWEDAEGKHAFWHTSAHLMAEAMQELYPGMQFGIGPAIENGFYYDVMPPAGTVIRESDFAGIEKKMLELAQRKEPVVRAEISKADALKFFGERGQTYKNELIEDLEDGHISTYTQGAFTDLCRGPHLMNTGVIKAVKVTAVSSAYWRGDEKCPQMTRVYAISFPKKKMLDEYLTLLEEAKKRDHRKIGKEMELFMFSERVGKGLPMWLPKGTALRLRLEDFLKKWRGALIMVTHDRYFLDSVCNRIVEVDKGSIYSYDANYSGYLELKAEREEMQQASERKRQNILRKELEWIRRGAKARTTKQKGRIQRYEKLKDQDAPQTDGSVEISSISSRMGKTTVELSHISKSYDSRVLIRDFTYIFLKNDRIGFVGANGSGKTTLMKIIDQRIQPDEGTVTIGQTIKIGYYTQEIENTKDAGIAYMDPNEKVIDYIKNTAEFVRTKDGLVSASNMLERFLFPSSQQYSPIGKLSGGEKRRLNLLRVLMEAPNVLILDEPTNDLDIRTLTILEDYLDNYDGIVITVSHDRYFLDRVVNRIFAFEEDGKICQYEGGYTDYVNRLAEEGKVPAGHILDAKNDTTTSVEKENQTSSMDTWKRERKLKFSYKEQKEYETIEDDIAALEQKIEELDAQTLKFSSDFVKLNEITKEKEQTEQLLEEKMERWEYLEDLAAKIAGQQ